MKKTLAESVIRFGKYNDFDKEHAEQVAEISLLLFDKLQPLHRMGNTERLWLHTAALMHDIAKQVDRENHHKLARDAIIECDFLPFRKKVRKMMGLIARYHRKDLPSDTHKHYKNLDKDSRRYVNKLAAILRIADGLSCYSLESIDNIKCSINDDHVIAHIKCTGYPDTYKAIRKALLFEQAFDKKFTIRLKTSGRTKAGIR